MEIYINGKKKKALSDKVSYSDVICLSEQPFRKDYSVTYSKGGNPNKPHGILSYNDVVAVKEGTVFCAMLTGSA